MKRIITCSDGTWNHPGEKSHNQVVQTNVQKIFHYIAPRDNRNSANAIEQLRFYDPGVGTTSRKAVDIFEGITGAGLDNNILDVYRFVCQHYTPGDEIYLFGFSRGAYTARSAAGFIRNSGLLKEWNEDLARNAFELYRDRSEDSTPDSEQAIQFKKRNKCYEPRIRLIGVWDTVGSLGIPLNLFQRWNHKRYAFHDVKLSRSVDFAFHALAIHERRNAFQPTLWELNAQQDPNYPQVLEQTWFSGVHSNVGGGYDDAGLSNIALKWMMCNAQRAGLAFDLNPELIPDVQGKLQNSASWFYKILGIGWRDICQNNNCNEKIHHTVALRKEEELPSSLRDRYKTLLAEAEDWLK